MSSRDMYPSFLLFLSCLVVCFFLPAALSAQNIWLQERRGNRLTLEASRTVFQSGYYRGASSGWVVFPALRLMLADRLAVIAEVPFAGVNLAEPPPFAPPISSRPDAVMANPYLGLELKDPSRHVRFDIGARLPVLDASQDEAAAGGVFADLDRLGAFAPGTLVLHTIATHRLRLARDFTLVLRFGPTFWFDIDNSSGLNNFDILLLYTGMLDLTIDRVRLMGGLTSRWTLGETQGGFDGRNIHHLKFAASIALGRLQPGLHVRLPVENQFGSDVDVVFGAQLSYVYGEN